MKMGCKSYKEKMLIKLNELSLNLAKRGEPDDIQLIEVIREIGDLVDPSIPCSFTSWNLWRKAYSILSGMNGKWEELRELKALLEYLRELNRFDLEWISMINLTSLATLIFTALLTGPSIPSYLSLLALLTSKSFPLETSIFSSIAIPFTILIQYSNLYPLAFTIGFFNAFSIFAPFKKKPRYEVMEKRRVRPEIKVSEEEVLRMLAEIYGKDAKEILDFLIAQLVIEGYTREEALSEIWARLTGQLGGSEESSA